MRLPLFIRRLICTYKMLTNPEYGGLLANWKNGEFEVIADWETDKELEAVWQLVENHMDSGRDEIYIAVVKQARGCGYIVIHAPGYFTPLPYPFWEGLIDPKDAFIAARNRCREIGTKMGYRAPEETNEKAAN